MRTRGASAPAAPPVRAPAPRWRARRTPRRTPRRSFQNPHAQCRAPQSAGCQSANAGSTPARSTGPADAANPPHPPHRRRGNAHRCVAGVAESALAPPDPAGHADRSNPATQQAAPGPARARRRGVRRRAHRRRRDARQRTQRAECAQKAKGRSSQPPAWTPPETAVNGAPEPAPEHRTHPADTRAPSPKAPENQGTYAPHPAAAPHADAAATAGCAYPDHGAVTAGRAPHSHGTETQKAQNRPRVR